MPVNVGEFNSEVTVLDGDLPLTEPQLNKMVEAVLRRLAEQEREQGQIREATTLRRRSAPALQIRE
jgi:hypothetical protein